MLSLLSYLISCTFLVVPNFIMNSLVENAKTAGDGKFIYMHDI